MAYEMIWEGKGLHRRYHGCTSDSELLESARLTASSARFEELRYVILDFLGVEGLTVDSASFIPEIAAADASACLNNPRIKLAVVTCAHEITLLAGAYAAHPMCAYPLQVFDNVTDARNWAKIEIPGEYPMQKLAAKPV